MNQTSKTHQDVAVRQDRRRHPRHLAEQKVLVYWRNRSGLPCETAAVLRNVSARGFAIELRERFPVGGAVTVRTSEGSLQCTVRHVQEQPDGFLAGLEVISVSDGSRWERSLMGLSSALADSVAK